MFRSSSQTFLSELVKKFWTAADKLRSNLDAAVYRHALLGLIFFKNVLDSFARRQVEIAVGSHFLEAQARLDWPAGKSP